MGNQFTSQKDDLGNFGPLNTRTCTNTVTEPYSLQKYFIHIQFQTASISVPTLHPLQHTQPCELVEAVLIMVCALCDTLVTRTYTARIC